MAMDPIHKRVLANKISVIMESISNPVVLSGYLKSVFSPSDEEEIKVKTTHMGATIGTQTLLSLLEKRGRKAFPLLIKVLRNYELKQEELATELEDEERRLRGKAEFPMRRVQSLPSRNDDEPEDNGHAERSPPPPYSPPAGSGDGMYNYNQEQLQSPLGKQPPVMGMNSQAHPAQEQTQFTLAHDDSPMAPAGSEGESTIENAGAADELNYEIHVMSDGETTSTAAPQGNGTGEDYMAMENDTAQENYEEPQQNEQDKQASVQQDEEYEMPGADNTDVYEVADQPPSADNAPTETDDTYDNDNDTAAGSVDGVPMAGKGRSGTVLKNLTKNTKPDNIEGVIKEGFLNKHRKEDKVYIGSKWQKRYCVVRNHVLYYFKDKKSPKQQGYILLPGYKVALANKKGREFTLTHPEGHRSFQRWYPLNGQVPGHMVYRSPVVECFLQLDCSSLNSKISLRSNAFHILNLRLPSHRLYLGDLDADVNQVEWLDRATISRFSLDICVVDEIGSITK